MNAKLGLIVRAARGPVMLITIGLLFIVQQSGALSFSKTWPLLLIVFGLMKLLERMLLPRFAPPAFVPPGYTPPGYVPPSYVPPAYVPPSYVPPSYEPPSYAPPQTPPPPPYGGDVK